MDVASEEMIQLAFHNAVRKSLLLLEDATGTSEPRTITAIDSTLVAGVPVANVKVTAADFDADMERYQRAEKAWVEMQERLHMTHDQTCKVQFSPIPLAGVVVLARRASYASLNVETLKGLWVLEQETLRRYEDGEKLKAYFKVSPSHRRDKYHLMSNYGTNNSSLVRVLLPLVVRAVVAGANGRR